MVVLGPPPLPADFQPLGAAARTAAPATKPVMTAAASADALASPASEPKPAGIAPAPRPAPADPVRIAPSPGPTVLAAPSAVAPPAPRAPARTESLSDQEIVERANGFFNNLTTLVADFTQIGGDGRRLGGTIYLQRPGKVRFEYDKPATLEVVADGSSVAVQDTKLATQDVYPISQTPLKFLLRERVNLGQDIRVTGVANEGDSVRLSLEDRSTLGGTSRITLFFDPQVETLTQWRIVDPQGFQTTVMLNKVDRNRRIDQKLFVINVNRAINNDNPSR
jgi:outer membrane lipoprotein-sorting protein